MTTVDPDFATWLQRDELSALSSSAATEAKWGALAADATISSPLADKADAADEAARQLEFLSGPLAIETLRVPGQRADLLGRVVSLVASKGGYANGPSVFVIGADETDAAGSTKLTVLRRMQ